MSEFMNKSRSTGIFRWQLLNTVSVLALIASAPEAIAGDNADRPTVWIELGGQLERVDSSQAIFSPPFFGDVKPSVLAPMVDAQKPPHYAIGGEGKLTFTPPDTNWVFSAAVRYGRSNANRHLHYQSNHPTVPFTTHGVNRLVPARNEFGDGQTDQKESHFILDFMAGKDVGLGLFGKEGKSVFSLGVRYAQFTSSSNGVLHARPTYASGPFYTYTSPRVYRGHYRHYRINTAVIQSQRNTHAIGPSVSWDASLPVVGDNAGMKLAFDWGVNAAVLFGRQRSRVHHQTSGSYQTAIITFFPVTSYDHGPYDHERARTVTIPNIGGFAGVSFRYLDAKVSFGYRADLFFGAMDGGIDTAKKSNVGFFGPFATISIGLGG